MNRIICYFLTTTLLLRSCLTDNLDLEPLSPGYDNKFAYKVYNNLLENSENTVVTFTDLSEANLEKICEQFAVTIYIVNTNTRINCGTYDNQIIYDGEPLFDEFDRKERDVEEEGSTLETPVEIPVAEEKSENANEVNVSVNNTEPKENPVNITSSENKEIGTEGPPEASSESSGNTTNTEKEKESVAANTAAETNQEITSSSPPDSGKLKIEESNVPDEDEATTPQADEEATTESADQSTTQEEAETDADLEPSIRNASDAIADEESTPESATEVTEEGKESKFKSKNGTLVKGNKSIYESDPNETRAEGPKDQESAEQPNKASSKDSTILIALFATVSIVGVAAFSYNLIQKKRRRRNATASDSEAVERGSALRRSLNSFTKTETPENKPLLLKGDQEMVELKNGKTAVEISSEAASKSEPKT